LPAQVEHLDSAVASEFDIGGLRSRWMTPLSARPLETFGNLFGDGQRFIERLIRRRFTCRPPTTSTVLLLRVADYPQYAEGDADSDQYIARGMGLLCEQFNRGDVVESNLLFPRV
jgi:hypothetical protein